MLQGPQNKVPLIFGKSHSDSEDGTPTINCSNAVNLRIFRLCTEEPGLASSVSGFLTLRPLREGGREGGRGLG